MSADLFGFIFYLLKAVYPKDVDLFKDIPGCIINLIILLS